MYLDFICILPWYHKVQVSIGRNGIRPSLLQTNIYIQGLEALAWQSYFLVLKNSSPTVLIYFLAHGDNLVLARTIVPMDCLTV